MKNELMNGKSGLFRAETTWFHIFHSMIKTGDVSQMGPHALTVYLVIKAHTNFQSGRSFPAIQTITLESGISRSQVIRELRTLEKFGYIAKTRIGRRNEYRLREKISIQDGQGQPAAVATWDYLPASVQSTITDLKNVLISGDFTESRVLHIERLQVNITNAGGNAVVFNTQEFACLPEEMRDLLMSLRQKIQGNSDSKVIHSSVRNVSD